MAWQADEKLCCQRSTRPKAVSPSGCEQKALLQRFLLATTAQQSFSTANSYPRESASIRG
jgi:hypothetical protein